MDKQGEPPAKVGQSGNPFGTCNQPVQQKLQLQLQHAAATGKKLCQVANYLHNGN